MTSENFTLNEALINSIDNCGHLSKTRVRFLETTFQYPLLILLLLYLILNIEKQLGNAVKRRQAFNKRFLWMDAS